MSMEEKKKKEKTLLAKYLKENGIKQSELLEKLDIEQSHLNRIYNGHLKEIGLKTAFKIATALDVSVETIFDKKSL